MLNDHGYGVYSGYAHLSVIRVTRGETGFAGQVIGESGTLDAAVISFPLEYICEWADGIE